MKGIDRFCDILRALHAAAPDQRFTMIVNTEPRNEGRIEDIDALTSSAHTLHERGRSIALRFDGCHQVALLSLTASGDLCLDTHNPQHGPISHNGGPVQAGETPEQVAAEILSYGRAG